MDPIARMFVRISYWLHHPPSRWQVWTMAVVAAISVVLFTIEWAGWWPQALTVNMGRTVSP